MLGSTNYFFSRQTWHQLADKRVEVYNVLLFKYGYTMKQSEVYLNAFDYFVLNPLSYDGSTLSKDLFDVDDLDLDAMLHDYWYIVYNVAIFVWKGFYNWYKLNGLRFLRLFYTPFKKITTTMTQEQIEAFVNDYYTLMI